MWQPIKTAPLDALVLVRIEDRISKAVSFDLCSMATSSDVAEWRNQEGHDIESWCSVITHWMPVPPLDAPRDCRCTNMDCARCYPELN